MSEMNREKAIAILETAREQYANVCIKEAFDMAIEALKESRPHGEWVWKEYDPDYDCGDIVCSKCSVVIYEGVPQARLKAVKWPFCPDCGAEQC